MQKSFFIRFPGTVNAPDGVLTEESNCAKEVVECCIYLERKSIRLAWDPFRGRAVMLSRVVTC